MWLALGLTQGCYNSGATSEFGSCCIGVRAWIFVTLQEMLLLPFCFKDARCAVGVVDGGWLDLPRSSLGGGVHRWQAQIQDGWPPMASSRLSWRVSFSAPFKAYGRWDSSYSRWHPASSSVAAAGDEDEDCLHLALGLFICMCIWTFSLPRNIDTYYQKKKGSIRIPVLNMLDY